jgi:hypothetical protein
MKTPEGRDAVRHGSKLGWCAVPLQKFFAPTMFKLLFYGVAIYLLYRWVFKDHQIGPPGKRDRVHSHFSKNTEAPEKGEYIDYEEVK